MLLVLQASLERDSACCYQCLATANKVMLFFDVGTRLSRDHTTTLCFQKVETPVLNKQWNLHLLKKDGVI